MSVFRALVAAGDGSREPDGDGAALRPAGSLRTHGRGLSRPGQGPGRARLASHGMLRWRARGTSGKQRIWRAGPWTRSAGGGTSERCARWSRRRTGAAGRPRSTGPAMEPSSNGTVRPRRDGKPSNAAAAAPGGTSRQEEANQQSRDAIQATFDQIQRDQAARRRARDEASLRERAEAAEARAEERAAREEREETSLSPLRVAPRAPAVARRGSCGFARASSVALATSTSLAGSMPSFDDLLARPGSRRPPRPAGRPLRGGTPCSSRPWTPRRRRWMGSNGSSSGAGSSPKRGVEAAERCSSTGRSS